MLTKDPMLQTDAFCEQPYTMQQNATAAGAPPWTTLGELQRGFPRSSSWF